MKYKSLICLLLSMAWNTTGSAAEPLNQVAAIVNEDVVLESELNAREEMVVDQLQNQQQTQLPPRSVIRKQVLDRLIIENLQLQMAERTGVRVDDETLNSNLRTMARQNGMSLADFREALEADNMDYVVFREQLRNQITMARIRQEMVDNRVTVTEQDVDNLLANAASNNDENREYRLSHILVSVPEAASAEQIQTAKKRAEDILARLQNGADFSQMAIAESDAQQALEGGDLGWRKTGQLPSFFSDVVGQLRKGQVSDLIRSPSGFHIVKITDIRGEERHLIAQTHVRHILLRADALSSEQETKIRIEQLYERLLEGADFANLARANSQDPGSASEGGDLGWVSPGQMVPEFEKVADSLQPGAIGKPFESRFGWHIVQVLARREHDDTEEYRRSRARESLLKLKKDEALEIWLRRLRDEAYIEYMDKDTSS